MVKGDRTKRIDALKTAANRFIDTIATQNQSITDESKQHQVAIVKFAGDKTTEVGNKKYRDSWGGHLQLLADHEESDALQGQRCGEPKEHGQLYQP